MQKQQRLALPPAHEFGLDRVDAQEAAGIRRIVQHGNDFSGLWPSIEGAAAAFGTAIIRCPANTG